jgi:hypothetical protein
MVHHETDHIMSSFAIVERRDTERFGEYRTKLRKPQAGSAGTVGSGRVDPSSGGRSTAGSIPASPTNEVGRL